MSRNGMLKHGPCPFIDQGDGRCSCRMTKQTLAQAFEFCLGGGHFACQTYHAISWQLQAASDESETELQPGTTTRLPVTQPGYLAQPAAASSRHPSAGGRQAIA